MNDEIDIEKVIGDLRSPARRGRQSAHRPVQNICRSVGARMTISGA